MESGAPWRRSSFCFGGDCVEVRREAARVFVRDSKKPGQKLDISLSSGVEFLSWTAAEPSLAR
ncbi:DUF397 domain-containing protein [Actinokineospora sp. NPDC004072]